MTCYHLSTIMPETNTRINVKSEGLFLSVFVRDFHLCLVESNSRQSGEVDSVIKGAVKGSPIPKPQTLGPPPNHYKPDPLTCSGFKRLLGLLSRGDLSFRECVVVETPGHHVTGMCMSDTMAACLGN